VLQWDSPFFSVGGTGTTNDVDVYIFNAAATQVLRAATTNNIASGDPVELLNFVNSGATAVDVNIMIVASAGPNPGRIKYVLAGGNSVVIQQGATNSGTIYGHANARGAAAVGAAFYQQTPQFGVNPPILESFSSGGTTPILFDTAGTQLGTPDPRANKPLIVAPDGVDTTFFGTDVDRSGFPNFFGTSAAAPHAGAVAALILQAAPTITPGQLLTALESTALDMGTPGFDNDSGFGLIQADAALMWVGNFQPLVAAVLPSSRSVLVGTAATAFATIINAGSGTATGCSLAPGTGLAATFAFQTTDPATNHVTGTANTPVDIPPGAAQSFVFAFTPSAPIAPTDVPMVFGCTNAAPATSLSGINTLLLSASATPVPDIVALSATLNNDGIVNVLGVTGSGVFAVATANVGAGDTVTASADTGAASLPIIVALCQTNPSTGQCISAIAPSVTTQINANDTPTFGIFVTGTGNVPFDPAANRVFVRFKDNGGVTRGSTSVAVRTQ
jgi:hypothetical protein